MEHRLALSHASGPAGEAILEKLAESGIAPDSLVLMDHESSLGKRLPYGGGHLSLEDQGIYDLSTCSLLLMPQADAELEAAALSQGCLLLSHAIDNHEPAVFVDGADAIPKIGYTQASLRLPAAELCCLLPALLELNRMQPLAQINLTLLRSAEFYGKAGIDELASQAVNLLNSRSVEPAVYAEQIAFNLLTDTTDPGLGTDLNQILGNNSYSQALQTVNVPLFHGFAAAVQLGFAAEVNLDDCNRRLSALENMVVKNTPASPISDCNQSFSCVISDLNQASNQPSSLQFWMIADPMRYGLANNYVNVSDFLLKSFL